MDLAEDRVHSAEGLVCVCLAVSAPQADTLLYTGTAFVVYKALCFRFFL